MKGYSIKICLRAILFYWILEEREAEFIIDKKEYDNDKVDDLLIINKRA
jgi:hypothetical protein